MEQRRWADERCLRCLPRRRPIPRTRPAPGCGGGPQRRSHVRPSSPLRPKKKSGNPRRRSTCRPSGSPVFEAPLGRGARVRGAPAVVGSVPNRPSSVPLVLAGHLAQPVVEIRGSGTQKPALWSPSLASLFSSSATSRPGASARLDGRPGPLTQRSWIGLESRQGMPVYSGSTALPSSVYWPIGFWLRGDREYLPDRKTKGPFSRPVLAAREPGRPRDSLWAVVKTA